MYNYKNRGRANDPRNIAALHQSQALANTILINQMQLCHQRSTPPNQEIIRARNHFQEFKSSYEHSLKNPSNQEENNFKFNNKITRQLESQLLNRNKMGKDIKTIPIAVPVIGTDAICKPSIYRGDATVIFLNKLRVMEMKEEKANKKKLDGVQQVRNSVKANIGKGLIRPSHLNSSCGSTTNVSLENNCSVKGTFPKKEKSKLLEDRRNKVMETLNYVNRRINKIQEKYLSESKHKYKSIKDIDSRLKTLYKNDDFKNDPDSSFVELKPAKKDKPKEFPDIFKMKDNNRKIFKVKKKSDSAVNHKHEISSDMSSDNYLLNKQLQENIEENIDEVGKEDVIYFNDVKSNSSDNESIRASPKFMRNINLSPEGVKIYDNDDAIMREIKDTISKSDYLMKEFNIKPTDLYINMNDVGTNTSSKKSVRFVPKPETFLIEKKSDKLLITEDIIKYQAQETLYDIKI